MASNLDLPLLFPSFILKRVYVLDLTIVMTSSTAERPAFVDAVLSTMNVFAFDFDVMSLSCLVRGRV